MGSIRNPDTSSALRKVAFLLFFLPCRDWYFVPYFSFL